jgi:hypothetical protein
MHPRVRTRIRLTVAGITGVSAFIFLALGLISGWRAVEVYHQTGLEYWQLGIARGLVYWGEPVAHATAMQRGSYFYVHTLPVEEVIDPPAPRYYVWRWELERYEDGDCRWLIPIWVPILALGTISVGLNRDTVRDRRILAGLCPSCNYDRRGLAHGPPCPEYGKTTAKG